MSSSAGDEEPAPASQRPSDLEPSNLPSEETPKAPLPLPLPLPLPAGEVVPREGSPAKSSGPEDPGDAATRDVLGEPGALPASVPLLGELRISAPHKPPAKKTVESVSGKRGGKSSRVAQASPSKASPEKKGVAGSVPRLVLGRKAQAYLSEFPPGLGAYPLVSGLPALGRAEKNAVAPWGPKQPRHHTGKKPAASRTKEPELVAQEDADRFSQPAPKGQFPASRSRPSRLSACHGVGSKGDSKTKSSRVPGNAQLLAMAQGDVNARVPPPTDDHGPAHHLRQRRRQPAPAVQSCPQCHVLQREVNRLKDELAAKECLDDKSQMH
nr:uncharacterized protein CXorf49 homolog [Oryctolagus cuniculus]XP_008247700.1 uncharacterized protein CXorf49 homolog [Oryctolagus cuniculus]